MSIAPPPTPSISADGAGAACGEQAVRAGPAGIDLADHRVGIDLDAVEVEPRGEAGVGEAFGRGGEAGGVLRDREQGHAVRGRRRAGGARGDDEQVGDMAVRDELLLARQLEAVARAFGVHRDLVAVLGALVDRERGDGLAREDAGEPALGLRGALQRLDRGDGGGEERGGRQVAPDFLQHHARLDMAEAEPASVFADQDAGEAHFGELLPQVAAEAGRRRSRRAARACG